MRYKVKGLEIRTENAAKPYGQGCRWILRWITQLPTVVSALDYGCGKFRYTIPLSKRVRSVCAVDSACQINRTQMVRNVRTTLVDYAREHLKNVKVFDVSSGAWCRKKYDSIICANVLSVIPSRSADSDEGDRGSGLMVISVPGSV